MIDRVVQSTQLALEKISDILISDDILRMFRFAETIMAKAQERINQVLKAQNLSHENTVVIGIHNRRGDIAPPNDSGYITATMEYFEAGMTYRVNSHFDLF